MIANLIALGLGPPVLGDVPNLLTPIVRQDALRYSAITPSGLYLVATVLAPSLRPGICTVNGSIGRITFALL